MPVAAEPGAHSRSGAGGDTANKANSLADERESLIGLTRAELAGRLQAAGVPPEKVRMRSKQLWHWIYHRGAVEFDAMTTMSGALRAALAARYTLARPETAAEQRSADGTRKWLLRFADGREVESVYIPEEDRGALCISSQVGCTLSCTFCHTGTQRMVRNLDAGEIVAQFLVARDSYGEWPSPRGQRMLSNIVMMGMGEPLYNYDNVAKALRIVMDPEGIALSRRRITLSTAGVVPMIERCGAELGVGLAVSLHAVRDDLRDELVPINRKHPIAELLDACRRYPGASNARRITFEYVMLKGVKRFGGRRPRADPPDRRYPGQAQPDPLQPVAGRALRVLHAGGDRALRRHRQPRGLCGAGARPRAAGTSWLPAASSSRRARRAPRAAERPQQKQAQAPPEAARSRYATRSRSAKLLPSAASRLRSGAGSQWSLALVEAGDGPMHGV